MLKPKHQKPLPSSTPVYFLVRATPAQLSWCLFPDFCSQGIKQGCPSPLDSLYLNDILRSHFESNSVFLSQKTIYRCNQKNISSLYPFSKSSQNFTKLLSAFIGLLPQRGSFYPASHPQRASHQCWFPKMVTRDRKIFSL